MEPIRLERVSGSGVKVQGLGLGQGVMSRIQASGFKIQG